MALVDPVNSYREFKQTLRGYVAQCERSLNEAADVECPVVDISKLSCCV